jgi:hypothetical protein
MPSNATSTLGQGRNMASPKDLTGTRYQHESDCSSCRMDMMRGECRKSKRECRHHCNHAWSHDKCCWCGEEFGEVDAQT